MLTMNDEGYMRLALQLAEAAEGQTEVNPVVGCVVVKHGRIIGMGAHLRRGEAHAEVNALNMAGAEAEGSTVYVTLEPCSHYGRTPPCAERLIRDKVARVVIACADPNPQVAGQGVAMLRASGIDVQEGVLQQEAIRINERFFTFMRTGRPFVTLKSACSLDGRLATASGDSKWISNAQARESVHEMRHRHQAIMVGVETALADDPLLTTRLAVPALQPVRIVVDSRLRLPETANVLRGTEQAPTWILTTKRAPQERERALARQGAVVIRCGGGERVDLASAMRLLAARGVGSVLLEGGSRLNGAMLEAGLVNKVVLFYAPLVIGGANAPALFGLAGFDKVSESVRLERLHAEMIGDNVRVSGYPNNVL